MINVLTIAVGFSCFSSCVLPVCCSVSFKLKLNKILSCVTQSLHLTSTKKVRKMERPASLRWSLTKISVFGATAVVKSESGQLSRTPKPAGSLCSNWSVLLKFTANMFVNTVCTIKPTINWNDLGCEAPAALLLIYIVLTWCNLLNSQCVLNATTVHREQEYQVSLGDPIYVGSDLHQ